jgi:hypothetical protein
MAEQGETIIATLRAEMAEQGETIIATLRAEMAEQTEGLRGEFRTEIRNLATEMRVLHVDVISRIAQLQEGWPRPSRPRPRKK